MRLPAVAPALALLAGVVTGAWRDAGPGPGALPAIWLCWALAGVSLVQRLDRLFAALALATFALCGWVVAADSADGAAHPPLRELLADHLGSDGRSDGGSGPVWLIGRVVHDAWPEPDGIRLTLDVEAVQRGTVIHPGQGRVLLSVAGTAAPGTTDGWRQGRLVRVPALLRRPTRYRDPGVSDGELALARRGVALVGSVKSPMLVEVIGRGSWAAESGIWLRERARHALAEHVGARDPRSEAIARAVLIGDRAGLDRDTTERLQQAGTYHVIAISGGNIAILTALLLWGFRVVRMRSPLSDALAAFLLVGYGWLVGGGASVVRATLMAVIYLAGRAIDLRSPPVNAVAVTGGLVLAVAPLSVFDPGTWLTFGATLGILEGVGGVLPRLGLRRRWSRGVWGLFLASCSAELVLFPVSASAFSRVTAVGLVANFAAVPLMSLVQIGGMATLASAAVGSSLVGVAGLVTHLAAWGLVESARVVEVLPWLTERVPAPGWLALTAYYIGLIVAASAWLRPPSVDGIWGGCGRPRVVGTVGTIAGAMALASAIWMLTAPHGGRAAPDRLRVTWMDVGQGDTALVELPGGKTLLVDAGGAGGSAFDIGRRVIAPVVWARGVRRLDYLAFTHADADHVNGAAVLTRDFRPAEVWEGVAVDDGGFRTDLAHTAADIGAAWRTVQRGDALIAGGAQVRIWHPLPADWERRRVRNDDSMVVEIRFGDVSLVMPGDIEAGAEAELASLVGPAPLRVAQSPHHGSATSTSATWLDAIAPQAVVISAGLGNRYGHPHAAVLGRLTARRLPVFRTDQDGAVTLETDGRVVEISTFSGRRWRAGPAGEPPRAR